MRNRNPAPNFPKRQAHLRAHDTADQALTDALDRVEHRAG